MSLLSFATVQNFVAAWVTVVAFVLFIISVLAFRKKRSGRIAMVCIAFLLFFIQGVILTYELFSPVFALPVFFTAVGLIDIAILLLIFGATLKR